MSQRTSQMYAVLLGLPVAAGTVSATAAEGPAAQPAASEQDSETIQTITVTGSRISRADQETSNTVMVMDRAQIEATSSPTLGALMQSIPQVAGTPFNSSRLTDLNDGSSDVNLRGLGSIRTLVLLNGMRVANVDVNSIPSAMIERVEVLTQGAAAIYGTDAIAGVVNFITRRDFSGVELSGSHGDTQDGGAGFQNMSAMWGANDGEGRALVGVNYSRQDGMRANQRDATAHPYELFFGEVSPNAFTSGFSPTGRFTIAGTPLAQQLGCTSVTRVAGTQGTSPGDFRCFNSNFGPGNTDRYNFKDKSLNVVPTERYSLFGSAEQPVAGNVRWYATGYYTNTTAHSEAGPPVLSNLLIGGAQPPSIYGNPIISADSIYNPFGADVSVFDVRAIDAGQRLSDYTTKTYQAMTGLRGGLGRFNWDINYGYGQSEVTVNRENFFDISKILQQIGPSFIAADGTPTCGTPTQPIPQCTPINLVGTTGATLSALAVPTNVQTLYEEEDISANITGELFNLPAGPVGVAVGAQYRKLNYRFRPDGLAASYSLSETNASPTRGSYDVTESYAETEVPLLRDLPLVDSLSVNLGGRHSRYSSFGSTTDGKYALQWRPHKDLLLRATYSDVYRAPNTEELYNGGEQSAPSFQDPCAGLTPAQLALHPDACRNVPAGYVKTQLQTFGSLVGNPDLRPETGYSTDFGLVYSPHFYQPLSVSLDRWRYVLEGAIQAVAVQSVIDACFNDSNSAFCGDAPNGQPYLQRASNGDLASVVLPQMNSNNFTTSGWDLDLKLNYPSVELGSWNLGRIAVGINLSYLEQFDFSLLDPVTGATSAKAKLAGQYDPVYTIDSFPRLRGLAFVSWERGPLMAQLKLRHIGSMTESQVDVADNFFFSLCGRVSGSSYDPADFPNDTGETVPGMTIVCERKVDAVNYIDLLASYSIDKVNAKLTFGVDDLFEQGIRRQYSLALFGFHNPLYDVRGRSFYGRVEFKF